jgi:EAL domain-containing protein (putative c-di-GMP-specific phosphodiesterase class I)
LQLDAVVAEGIETAQQRDELLRLGFTIGQGYYLARPQTAQEMTRLLEQNRVGISVG